MILAPGTRIQIYQDRQWHNAIWEDLIPNKFARLFHNDQPYYHGQVYLITHTPFKVADQICLDMRRLTEDIILDDYLAQQEIELQRDMVASGFPVLPE